MPEETKEITAKIEEVAQRGREKIPSRPEPVFSPEEKAEQLWGLFNEYSVSKRAFYKKMLREKLSGRSIKKLSSEERDATRKELSEQPLVQRLEGEIVKLWKEPQVRSVFQTKLKEAFRERKFQTPNLERYQKLSQRSGELHEEYFELMRNQFLLRQMTPTLRGLEIARNREERKQTGEEIRLLEENGGMLPDFVEVRGGLDKEHADLAALLAFEGIKKYHHQFRKEGFIRTPSREALLEEVLTKTANGTWMLLVGETGTGKTRFAEIVSFILNSEPPLYASGEERGDVVRLIGTKAITKEQETYYEFGPLVAAITGCSSALEIGKNKEVKGKIFVLDELNKFNPEALFGALKTAHNLRPGKKFNYKELHGLTLQMAERGFALIATMNPATVRYERRELDPALERLFSDGKRVVDYPPMTPENPELYEIFLAILMDNNGRIRIPKEELAPAYIEVKDEAKGIITQEMERDTKKHGALYRFALAAGEIHKSFTQKENVAKTATDPGFLERTVLDMGVLVDWMNGYGAEIEGGVSLTTYLERKISDFYGNIESENDRAIFKRIFGHFGFNVESPLGVPKPPYKVLTPVEMGYLTPRTKRAVIKFGEEVAPETKIFVLPDGTEVEHLPVPIIYAKGTLVPETIVIYNGKRYQFLGKDPTTGEILFAPLS